MRFDFSAILNSIEKELRHSLQLQLIPLQTKRPKQYETKMIRSVINSIFRTIIITGNTWPVLQAYASILCIMVIAAAQRRRPKSHAAAGYDRPARRRRTWSNGLTPPPKRIVSARMSTFHLQDSAYGV
jgi:hypothetical protein